MDIDGSLEIYIYQLLGSACFSNRNTITCSNWKLQKAYFKCAYECFDRAKKQEVINNCVENCSVPVLNANNLVETEMAKFQVLMPHPLFICCFFSLICYFIGFLFFNFFVFCQ